MMGPTRDDAESSQDPREGGEEMGKEKDGLLAVDERKGDV